MIPQYSHQPVHKGGERWGFEKADKKKLSYSAGRYWLSLLELRQRNGFKKNE